MTDSELENLRPLQLRITELAAKHGSLRAAARILGVDAGYLSRLRAGEKSAPSKALLRKMGLRAVITYERTAPSGPGKG